MKYHNSIVGHFGISNTLKAMSMGQHWKSMQNDATKWIGECSICQKIKMQKRLIWRDEIEHHFYHLKPLASLSVDTLGPLPR